MVIISDNKDILSRKRIIDQYNLDHRLGNILITQRNAVIEFNFSLENIALLPYYDIKCCASHSHTKINLMTSNDRNATMHSTRKT